MRMPPQMRPYLSQRIGKGRRGFGVPSSLPRSNVLMSRQRMREQGDDGEQTQQGGCRASNGQVSPLSLSFDTKMSTDFLKRHLHLPTLDEEGHYLSRGQAQISRQQGLRAEFVLRVANQHPADRYRRHAGVIPDGGRRRDFYRPLRFPIPARDDHRGPGGGRVLQDLVQGGQALPFQTWSSHLAGGSLGSRVVERGIQAQAGTQRDRLGQVPEFIQQREHGK